jgi:hypothetical protein
MRISPSILAAALIISAPALAQQVTGVTLKAETFVAKMVKNAQGKEEAKLFPALRVVPGDPLVMSFAYANGTAKPAANFAVNAPIPSGVEFTRVPDAVAVVSVDGGKAFGALATLKVKTAAGQMRPALPSDVTNIRWTFARPIAPGAKGTVMYYGIVK